MLKPSSQPSYRSNVQYSEVSLVLAARLCYSSHSSPAKPAASARDEQIALHTDGTQISKMAGYAATVLTVRLIKVTVTWIMISTPTDKQYKQLTKLYRNSIWILSITGVMVDA